ncbi:MAG: AAA family ATPase [Clostridia bacterium]|nr:AAA family ATPase [Clostridia bacterium]
MRIEKLEIKSFGKLKGLELKLSDGINIVFGNNESGKTSVQTFIKGMLYGLKGGRTLKDGSLPTIKKYKPWNGEEYNGVMEYRLDNGETYRIERDFSNNAVRVYDSLFNDISGSFEMTKDRGPLFADKHLGINETCFEKTVFIKQMESRIDEDAGRELFNRLLNVSQTGFEDISLLKAQEALKEAQKNYVGTDKTSTRPLDRIVARLEELKTARNKAIEKRDTSFRIEKDLQEQQEIKKSLEDRRNFLDSVREVFNLKKEIDFKKKQTLGLKDILESIQHVGEERETVLKRLHEMEAVRQQLEKYSSYSSEDLDNLSIGHHNMTSLENENRKLVIEKNRKDQQLLIYKNRREELKAFEQLNTDEENKVLTISKELEHLKSERERNNINVLDEKIKTAMHKAQRAGINLTLSLILLLCGAGAWFFNPVIAYVAVPVFMVLSVGFALAKTNSSKELGDIQNVKKVAFVFSNGILEEIEKKQKYLDEILRKTKTSGVEEFFKLKAEYDSIAKQLEQLEQETSCLAEDIASNSKTLSDIKSAITEMLLHTGIIQIETEEIKEEHISEFKNCVRRFLGFEPSVNYVLQRVKDLEESLNELYRRASDICSADCRGSEHIRESLETLTSKLNSLVSNFQVKLQEVEKGVSEMNIAIEGLENLSSQIEDMGFNELESLVNFHYNSFCEDLNSTQLRIKEYETLLKGLDSEENEIQEMDREIEELDARKNELVDISVSLKTALDLLTEAGMEIQRDFAPALNQKMSKIIRAITSDRYKDLRADDRLILKAITPESGDVVPASSLSGGTIDQVYLSLRMAMAELISTDGEKLPLIMDEIFAQYDDLRTRETLKYFNDIKDGRQVVFFTCKKREIAIAREVLGGSVHVIELD